MTKEIIVQLEKSYDGIYSIIYDGIELKNTFTNDKELAELFFNRAILKAKGVVINQSETILYFSTLNGSKFEV